MLGHKWRLQLFLIQKHEWYDFSTVFGIRAKGNETLICSCAVMEVVDRIRRLCLFYRLTLTDSKKNRTAFPSFIAEMYVIKTKQG
jgi:hypothetical protein